MIKVVVEYLKEFFKAVFDLARRELDWSGPTGGAETWDGDGGGDGGGDE